MIVICPTCKSELAVRGETRAAKLHAELNASPTDAARRAAEEITVAGIELKDDIQPWLTEQCSRLMYGQCTTARCVKRGGWTGGGYDPAIATCEAYEVSNALPWSRYRRSSHD